MARRILRTAHIPLRRGVPYDRTVLLEAVENGFNQIGLGAEDRWYQDEEGLSLIESIGRDAASMGLTLSILTCYQRQCPEALHDHPEWRMVFEDDSLGSEACPFHEEYRDLYIAAMQRVARAAGVEEIQLNDEAHLTDWGSHYGCYCPRCTELFRSESGVNPPHSVDWQSALWRRWVRWRLENWVRVMREIADAVRQANPRVLVSSQFDPSVCLRGWSPWFSGVDIAGLAEVMDLLRVDPYHTFHPHDFRPDVTYITEHVRYLRGALGGKPLRVWTQDFVRPEFSRTLDAHDGVWTAVLPVALGAEACTPYAYPLMQELPAVAHAYEDAFRLDRYYAEVEPLRHVAVVQGWQTKTWLLTDMRDGQAVYDTTHFRPACAVLRRGHLPYDHLWDRRLSAEHLAGYRALLMPRVASLSTAQAAALRDFGGGVVLTSDTGCYDEWGQPAAQQAFGSLVQIGEDREFGGVVVRDRTHPLTAALPAGTLRVRTRGFVATPAAGATVLATFADASGSDTGLPAIVVREGPAARVWFSFEPLQARTPDVALISQRALAERLADLLVRAVRWAAGGDPLVAMETTASPGVELMVSTGPGMCVVTLGNYYLEDGTVTLRLAPDERGTPYLAFDATARRALPVLADAQGATLTVSLDREAVKVIVLRFSTGA